MASKYGTVGNDYIDFIGYGNSDDYGFGDAGNDTMYGWDGNDTLDGWTGNDTLYGENGNDTLLGYDGQDTLYGGAGNDYLYGENGYDILKGGDGNDHLYGGASFDDLYGGKGVDTLSGGNDGSADYFYFDTQDTGDVYQGKADTITDFTDSDQIFLKGSYTYDASGTSAPGEGQYSIWQKDGNFVVTYNSTSDSGYHDIVVKGGDPHGDISFY
ncbi:calcium-binding protein [Methylobacterium nigriterrae]|uniref:calcium-binding protein n=2 Tax=Methylobacterium nigriterrae TaxID=3127512 RepID=UPI003013BB28